VTGSEFGLPVLGSLIPFQLTDQHNRPFGNRELHGRLSVVVLSTGGNAELQNGTSPAAAVKAADLLLEGLSDKPFHRILMLIGIAPPIDAEAGLLPLTIKEVESVGQSGVQHRIVSGNSSAITSLVDSVYSQVLSAKNKDQSSLLLALIDPIGRVRGRYDLKQQDDGNRLLNDLQSVWDEQIPFVAEVFDTPWLEPRRQAQLKTADSMKVLHSFSFADRQQESGIRFLHQIVDDAGRTYKGVHYDHGNGMAIADVDNDQLIDVYFTTQLGDNELYRNLGDGRFENVTEKAGVAVGDRVCVAATFADIDNDSDADLYVTSVRKGNLLFQNDGHGVFTDITAASGLESAGHDSAAAFLDYDRDGLLDVFVTHVGKYTTEELGPGGYYIGFDDAFAGHLKPERTEISRLYRNVNGTSFQDITEEAGIADGSWTGDVAVLDGNRDGWPDLYLLNMQGNDEYYENQQGKTFVKRSRELFPKTPFGTMGIAVADFDNDLDFDLFVTDMHSDMSKDVMADYRSEVSVNTFFEEEKLKMLVQLPEALLQTKGASLFGNAFYRNDGPNQFTEISDTIGAENYWPWGLSTGDLNADGFEDAFVTSGMNYPYRYAVNSILLNDQGQHFVDSEFILGAEPRKNGATAQPWMLINCDAELNDRLKKVCDGRRGEVVVWGALGSRSSAVFDIDSDGDLDIVTSEMNDTPMVLVSDLAQKNQIRFIKVVLEGIKSNRQGLGAEVTVSAGDKRFLKRNDGATGYLSHGIPHLYFGLGAAAVVDSIEVRWPSGTVQTLNGPIASGQLLRIREE